MYSHYDFSSSYFCQGWWPGKLSSRQVQQHWARIALGWEALSRGFCHEFLCSNSPVSTSRRSGTRRSKLKYSSSTFRRNSRKSKKRGSTLKRASLTQDFVFISWIRRSKVQEKPNKWMIPNECVWMASLDFQVLLLERKSRYSLAGKKISCFRVEINLGRCQI